MTENSDKAQHDEMERDLVGYLEQERCLNFREILERYVKTHDVLLESIAGEVNSALERLEAGTKVLALFPRGVNSSDNVPMEQRFYKLAEPPRFGYRKVTEDSS